MKRTLKSIAVLALSALAMVSCQKELLGPATQEGQEVEVSLDLTTPLMGTKAYADGNTVNVVHVHVYQQDAQGNLTYITPAAQGATTKTPSQDVAMSAGAATYSTRLVTGQTYTFVFWAENSSCSAYTYTPGTQTVTVSYANAAGNDESRDAFYAVLENVTITGAYSASVTLKRPFAQINFGASDYEAAKAAGIEVTGAAVKLTGIGNSINLLNGTVSGSEVVTFANADLTSDPNDPNATLTVAGVVYKYVAMDYVLVGNGDKTLSDVTLTLAARGTLSTTPEYTYTNVPLQGNYRTNIVGSLFTSPADINITVNPAFGNQDENIITGVANLDAANTAFENGATAVTVEEITSSDPDVIVLPATTAEVSLTLPAAPDGKTITIKYPDSASNVPATVNIKAVNAASLTIVAPQTHVEVNGITVTNLTASTSNTTLVIGDDVTVTNLTIEAGAVEIYGNVGTLTKGANAGDVKVWAVGDIETWKKAYTAGAQRIELTANISSAEDTNLYVPIQGTVDGNRKEISGSISLNVNALGGTIQNLNFKNIHKSGNTLSAIYASGLSGTLVITGCAFDTFDWDAIQTTPVAGAKIEIVDNTFRYSADPGTNNRRYIHIESKKIVDFAAKVNGNSFYDNAKLMMSAIEVYDFADANKIDVNGNYIDAPAKVCILGQGWKVATEILKAMTVKTAPDGEEVNLAGYINIRGDQRIFTSLSDAFAAVAAGQTIVMLRDITSNSGFLFDKEVSASFDLGGNTLKVTEASNANGRAIRIDKGTLTVKTGTIDARNVDSEGNPADETSNESGGMFGAIRVNETAQAVLENLTMYNNHFYGLCIKPASGTTVTMRNCTINSYIGGCIEVAGANTTISNCTFKQSGQSSKSWISTAIAVSYGGVANVTDTQITADAEIPLYIYNSGGTLNINGGTYVGKSGKVLQVDAQASNQSYSSTASITGGTFTGAFGKTNTGKEKITVTGGSYSFNPTDYVPSGYTVSEVDGKYVVSAQ